MTLTTFMEDTITYRWIVGLLISAITWLIGIAIKRFEDEKKRLQRKEEERDLKQEKKDFLEAEYREKIMRAHFEQADEVKGLRRDIKDSYESIIAMFAEELHPLSARVKRLKRGLNIVESKNSIPLTSFEDFEEN